MIYRQLEATRRKVDISAEDRDRETNNIPRSVIFKKIIEDKRHRTTSTGSTDGTVITQDNRIVKIVAANSVANSPQVIPEKSGEGGACSNVNEVSSRPSYSVDLTYCGSICPTRFSVSF